MSNLIDDPKARSHALWRGRAKAAEKRTGTHRRGRPIKPSGLYFTEHVLLDPETFDYVMQNKRDRHEPIGAVIRRMALMQKKAVAPVGYNDRGSIDTYSYDINTDPDYNLMFQALERQVAKEQSEKSAYR